MTGPAQQFRSRQEIETRRSFDPSCGIELAEFASLVGAYEFPENEQSSASSSADIPPSNLRRPKSARFIALKFWRWLPRSRPRPP
jgi:hypothetical protein